MGMAFMLFILFVSANAAVVDRFNYDPEDPCDREPAECCRGTAQLNHDGFPISTVINPTDVYSMSECRDVDGVHYSIDCSDPNAVYVMTCDSDCNNCVNF